MPSKAELQEIHASTLFDLLIVEYEVSKKNFVSKELSALIRRTKVKMTKEEIVAIEKEVAEHIAQHP